MIATATSMSTSTSVIAVGLGDLFLSRSEDLVAYSLGSCIGTVVPAWEDTAR